MHKYSRDYGVGWHGTAFALRSKTPIARPRLNRQEAARVIAEPLPERTQGERWGIVRPLAIGFAIIVLWALAWLVAFAS